MRKCTDEIDINNEHFTDKILDFDIYIDNDNDLSNYSNVPPRVSKDHVTDLYGRRLIEFCQSTSFVIGNSRLYNDPGIGDCTYYSLNEDDP